MKKFDWNRSVTRKDYAVLCVWSFGIGMLVYGLVVAMNYWDKMSYWDKIKTWAKRKVEKIKTKLPWCG